MRGFARFLIAGLKLLMLALLGAFALTLRYLWSTPQPLRSNIPGDPRIYKWTHGAIFYTIAGPADATPLVLLHAPTIGGSSYEMRHLIAGLAQSYRVYVPDLLGFGLSDRPRLDYTAETYVQLCQDFVADVIAQPALLLGSGLSCNYSVAVAARRPDLCRGIIALSPRSLFAGPGSMRMLPRWLTLLIEHPLTALPFYSLFTTRMFLRIIVTWPYVIKNTTSGTVDHVQVSSEELASIFANAHQFGAEHAALAWMAGKLNLDVLPQFEQLTLPVLTLWHRHTLSSISATGGQHAHMLSERMTVMESSGPRIHEEQPAQVVANILAWQTAQEPANIATAANETQEELKNVVVAETTAEDSSEVESLPSLPYPQSEAYCVRCRQKRTMQDPHKIVTKNGRNALEGTCPVCNTRLFRFIKG